MNSFEKALDRHLTEAPEMELSVWDEIKMELCSQYDLEESQIKFEITIKDVPKEKANQILKDYDNKYDLDKPDDYFSEHGKCNGVYAKDCTMWVFLKKECGQNDQG